MATITHTCGHKRRVTLNGGTATTKSGQAFDLAQALCPQCAQTQREQKEAADAVYAEYVREQERLAARRYVVTLHYDEHPTLDPHVMWEGTGFWVAAEWAQNAAKSLIATTAHAYVEHNAENTEYRAYRRNWAHNGQSYTLVGHASVTEVPETREVERQTTRTSTRLTRDGSPTRDHELLVTRQPVALCVGCGEVLCDDGEDDLERGICLSCQCD